MFLTRSSIFGDFQPRVLIEKVLIKKGVVRLSASDKFLIQKMIPQNKYYKSFL